MQSILKLRTEKEYKAGRGTRSKNVLLRSGKYDIGLPPERRVLVAIEILWEL
jgi:hypothetical protein